MDYSLKYTVNQLCRQSSLIDTDEKDYIESQTAQLVMVTCGDEISMAH